MANQEISAGAAEAAAVEAAACAPGRVDDTAVNRVPIPVAEQGWPSALHGIAHVDVNLGAGRSVASSVTPLTGGLAGRSSSGRSPLAIAPLPCVSRLSEDSQH